MKKPHRIYRPVTTIASTAKVEDAAHIMNVEAIGCVVVLDAEEQIVGILTDRDLALRVVGRTCDPAALTVADVMTPEVITVTTDDDFTSVIGRMRSRGVRRVPVLEDGKLIGMVGLDDLLQTLAREIQDLGSEARQRYRHANDSARYDHLREGTEHRLQEIAHRLAFANWFARKSFIDELDSIRERLRHSVGAD